jgi:hypothetical protein
VSLGLVLSGVGIVNLKLLFYHYFLYMFYDLGISY